MTDPDRIRATVTAYLEAVSSRDPDRVMALFAAEPVVEDPVGSARHEGAEAVRAFYAGAAQLADSLQLTLATPIQVAAGEAAFGFTIRATAGGTSFEVYSIDVMTFDADGRITSMRAFWDPADVRAG